jgi:uncharacterized protein
MIRYLPILMLWCFSSLCYEAKAVEVRDLYLVKLPVAEQGRTVLWNASLKGFKEVLVRKSGSSEILTSAEVQRAYRKVTSYLQRFEYASQEPDSEFPFEIALYFEPRLIDSLIQQSQMPLWGSNRPLTIMWLAVEENFNREVVVESEEEGSFYPIIQKNASRRGLPIILPLMDLEDELAVSISDIWGRFPSAINQASARYPSDVVLFGRINQVGDTWQGKFGYINQQQEVAFDAVGESKQQVVANMMDSLAERLCEKYCVVQEVGQKNELLINVTDISNFKQFKAAENYLADLSSVNKVEVVKISKYDVLFKLTLLGQINSTVEGIALSQKMVATEPPKLETEQAKAGENKLRSAQISNPDSNVAGSTKLTQEPVTEDLGSQNGSKSETENLISKDQQVGDNQSLSQQESVIQPLIKTLYYRWIG